MPQKANTQTKLPLYSALFASTSASAVKLQRVATKNISSVGTASESSAQFDSTTESPEEWTTVVRKTPRALLKYVVINWTLNF